MLKQPQPNILENTLTMVVSREEVDSRGLSQIKTTRHIVSAIDGFVVVQYPAHQLHYYFGTSWMGEIDEHVLADMIHDDFCDMDILSKAPSRYINCYGRPLQEDISSFTIEVSNVKIDQNGAVFKVTIPEVESRPS